MISKEKDTIKDDLGFKDWNSITSLEEDNCDDRGKEPLVGSVEE